MCLSDIDHIMYNSACSMFIHVSYMYHTLSVHHAIASETTNQLIVYSHTGVKLLWLVSKLYSLGHAGIPRSVPFFLVGGHLCDCWVRSSCW